MDKFDETMNLNDYELLDLQSQQEYLISDN